MKAPAFHRQNGYKNPTDPIKTVFSLAYGKPDGAAFFEILMSTPHAQAMNVYISNFNKDRKDWSDFYPVEERLGKGAETNSDAVMMVDVGGGLGHQAVGLKKKFPQLPGRFVVQDLMSLPPESDRVDGVEYVVHDFLKEQPIKGSWTPQLSSVLRSGSSTPRSHALARELGSEG
jgi:demethylsterigmatocystin 6-O-methyltransferase